MIKTKHGNLLDAKGIIVHGCNCQGVMGSGVALQIRNKWPVVYKKYLEWEQTDGLRLGYTQGILVEDGVWVVNALTQKFYGRTKERYVDYEAVATAFEHVKHLATRLELPVHFPLIGCGLAGGNWAIVKELINDTLGPDIEKTLWINT